MKSWEILELAARHYAILKCLSGKKHTYNELGNKVNIPRSTLGNYIRELAEAGLVVEEKEGDKKLLKILEKGRITFEYINKYKLLILEPTLDDDLREKLDGIIDYYGKNYEIKGIEELLSKELIILCNRNPKVIFHRRLQNFFEDYLNKQKLSMDINGVISRLIGYIMQNSKLKTWFYERIFPIFVDQANDRDLNYQVRNTRVVFLWETYNSDKDRRDKILNIFIKIIENECKSQDEEICKYIRSSYQPYLKEDIYKRLSKLNVKEEILIKFLS